MNAGVDVMGYLRPKEQYNKGKVSEANERLMFEEQLMEKYNG